MTAEGGDGGAPFDDVDPWSVSSPPPDLPPLFSEPEAKSGLRIVDPNEAPPEPRLQLNKQGNPRKNLANVIDMLSRHDDWRGAIAYDAFRQCIVKVRPPPVRKEDASDSVRAGEWTDADTIRTCAWLSSRPLQFHRLDVDGGLVDKAIIAVAEQRVVHPVRDWFESLRWDGKVRLDGLFPKYFRAHDTQFTREAGKRWMISAVARIYRPGCQVKYMPVLESPQDFGKSTGLQALFGSGSDGASWYSDTGLTIGNKDSYQCLRAKLGYEWSDLSTMRSARDVESLKVFISSTVDNYRPSYGHRNRDFPRQCVFVGTTNEDRWLTDPTGGSRFWPVRCYPLHILRDEIAADRDMLWAEAVARFQSNERWWIDGATEAPLLTTARSEQSARREIDPWQGTLETWLARPTVPDGAGGRSVVDVTQGFAGHEALLGALEMRKGDMTRAHETRLGYVLRELGFDRRRVRTENGGRAYLYFPADAPRTDDAE